MDQPLCNLGLPGFLCVFQLLLGRNNMVRRFLDKIAHIAADLLFLITIHGLLLFLSIWTYLLLFLQAFPEAATVVLCVCQHAELSVCLAGHHLAHPAQPTARDPARGVPQTPRAPRTTGRAETHTHTNTHTHLHFTLSLFIPLPLFLPLSRLFLSLSVPDLQYLQFTHICWYNLTTYFLKALVLNNWVYPWWLKQST